MIIMEDIFLISVILAKRFFLTKFNEDVSPRSQKYHKEQPQKIISENSSLIKNTDHKQILTIEDSNLQSEKQENKLDIIHESKAEKDYIESLNSSCEKTKKNKVKKSIYANYIKQDSPNSNNDNILNSKTEQKSESNENISFHK